MTFRFPPMLGPMEEHPEGSPDYVLRLGNTLSYTVPQVDEIVIRHLLPLVRKAIEVKAWERWPEPPCGSPDAFFRLCTGHSYSALRAVILALRPQLDLPRFADNAGEDN